MTLLRTTLMAGACALGLTSAVPTGLSAETLRWGGGRDVNSMDPCSFGSS